MALNLGSSSVDNLYLGSNRASSAYLGADKVWPNQQPYVQEVLKDNPLGLWMLDDETTGVARDLSGNGRDGLYAGTVTIGTASAPSRQLSRTARTTNGRAILPVDLAPHDTITIEFWVRQINYSSNIETLIEHTIDASTRRGFLIYTQSGQLRVYVRTSSTAYRTVTVDNPPAGQWYFYSIVLSRTTPWIRSVRRNGVNLTYTISDGTPVTGSWESPANLHVGQRVDGTRSSNAYFTGVAIYAGEVNSARRNMHFYSSFYSWPEQPYVTAAKRDGAIHLFMLDERHGDRIADQAGVLNAHGLITGGSVGHDPEAPSPQFDGCKAFFGGMASASTLLINFPDLTVEFWWKPEFYDGTWVILELSQDSNNNNAFNLFYQYSTLTATVRSPGVSRERHMWSPELSSWYFVSITYSRSSPWVGSIRINGVEQATTTTGEGTPGPSWDIASLYLNSRGNGTLSGISRYAGLAIYPRLLTDAERDSHYLASFL